MTGPFSRDDCSAILLDGVEVNGDVFLGFDDAGAARPFRAEGGVRLVGAKVDGWVALTGDFASRD